MRAKVVAILGSLLVPWIVPAQTSGGLPALKEELVEEVSRATAVEGGLRSDVTALQTAVDMLQQQNAQLQGDVAALQAAVAALQASQAGCALAVALSPYVSVEPGELSGVKGPHVLFTGVNVHVRSGEPSTFSAADGLGNLIVGWNEPSPVFPPPAEARWGSNNLAVGAWHEFRSTGGLVAGEGNRVWARGASVTGGYLNTASGELASVSGGYYGTASGRTSSVSGGNSNAAAATCASVSGGESNVIPDGAFGASVSGGLRNTASQDYASVSGGYLNTASGDASTVCGGVGQTVTVQWGYAPYP